MAKPAGAGCNLACAYCYYRDKQELHPEGAMPRMALPVLEAYIRGMFEASDDPEVAFTWQGGEPTLLGVRYFRHVLAHQRKWCPPGRRFTNALQTNGTLLDATWADFLRANGFLVGLSLDGPRALHDGFRRDRGGAPTFDKALAGLRMLIRHGVAVNVLTVVHRLNAGRPLDVYRFLRDEGVRFMQFIPLVERVRPDGTMAGPPDEEAVVPVAPWCAASGAIGEFLCRIFDEWSRKDVGRVFVQLFDVQLAIRLGLPSPLCTFAETCGRALALEANGDVYACDHFVRPAHLRGNVLARPLTALADDPAQVRFGEAKRELPGACHACDWLMLCRGGCPRQRFGTDAEGKRGLNYLCAGYRKFFEHTDDPMREMAAHLRAGRPASMLMATLPPV